MSLLSRELSGEELASLERLAASRKAEARLVERANIVLVASRTRHMCDAVRALGKDKHTIRTWSKRFEEEGLAGLQDRPRSGHPCIYSADDYAKVIQTSLSDPRSLGLPFGAWTLDRLTTYLHEQGLPMSRNRIAEVLRGEGLRWRQEESWPYASEGPDPAFAQKRGPLSGHTRNPRMPQSHSV
jgi:transposase